MFSFEALEAKYGDSLLLHFGTDQNPRLVVIDGGPRGVFQSALKPRLLQLRGERGIKDTDVFSTDLIMVSHIDDDHIHGILDWFVDMAHDPDGWEIKECWFNSFPDIIKKSPKMKTAALGEEQASPYAGASQEARAIIASVPQGRELRNYLNTMGIRVNSDRDVLYAPASLPSFSKGGLKLVLLAPNKKALDRLEGTWEATPMKTAALDNAVENLSSLVVMAECDGHRVLLTGDARGDYIVEGLKQSGYLEESKCYVDVLKLPHHGSSRNCTEELFQTVIADHYVISANGKYDNPDASTLCLLAQVRDETDEYTIHLTNTPSESDPSPEGKKLYQNVQEALDRYPWLAGKLTYGNLHRPILISF